MRFVGREDQLAWLDDRLREVKRTGLGQMISIRGRRQVGKSRLAEEFLERSAAKAVYYTATRQSPASELVRFSQVIATSATKTAGLADAAPFGSWETALTLLGGEATKSNPIVVVIDEFPYLIDSDPAIDATLQAAWQQIERQPVLLILIGSDLSTMESLNTYGRPLYGRLRELVVPPFSPAETADRLGLSAVDALDAYLVIGGMPRLAALWEGGDDLWSFLGRQFEDASSPLIVLGERSVNAELPADLRTRSVLAAIGADERAYTGIQQRAGVSQTTLNSSLAALEDKRIVEKHVPYSTRSGAGKNTRYVVADPYLRFWLRFVDPNVDLAARGRGDVLLDEVRKSWLAFRGRAIEPIIRRSIERLLPDPRFGNSRFIGSFWTRDHRTEVDLVGGIDQRRTDSVELIGTIKWRDTEPLDRSDVARLIAHRSSIPGADERALLVGVSRTGYSTGDLDLALEPKDIVDAWRVVKRPSG